MTNDLSNIFQASSAVSCSLSPENPTGEKGAGGQATFETTLHPGAAKAARELGVGWKLSPCVTIPAQSTYTVMDHDGPGLIRHMWFTMNPQHHRSMILRIYWDGQPHPSVEAPLGDFFCNSWKQAQNIAALPINVNPYGGLNCYFPMPFGQHARITLENDSPHDHTVYYTINYTQEPIQEDALYFHARFRRTNPVPYGEQYTILDHVAGKGQYVGTYIAWQNNTNDWWGEGELMMYIDGDQAHPTIIGTGTEDYFGGAWGFEHAGECESFSAPYMGYIDVQPDTSPMYNRRNCRAGSRSVMYRFHIPDPIFFKTDLKVTMQCLGWRSDGRYLPLQDDVASVAYWYQTLPHAPFPPLPDRNYREII